MSEFKGFSKNYIEVIYHLFIGQFRFKITIQGNSRRLLREKTPTPATNKIPTDVFTVQQSNY